MQQKTGLLLPALVAIGTALAALTAPPSVFANTGTGQQAAPALPAQPANPIRIGVGRSQTLAEVSAPGGLLVIGDGAVHWEVPPGQVVQLKPDSGQIEVVGLALRFSGPVRLVPVSKEQAPAVVDPAAVPVAPANPVTYNRKGYRGEIEVLVSPKDRRLSVVNVVNMEEYLLGVVPVEMPHTWPLEALKAQAVAARSYATRNRGQYKDEGFDLVDTVMSQAYGGLAVERPATGQAVVATRGQVLMHNDQVAVTFFHASSGGHTENNDIIFAGPPIAYLRGVPDYDNLPGNSRFAWRYTYTPDEFAKALSASSYAVGTVTRAEPAGGIGASGRPKQWTLVGTKGTFTLAAQQLRTVLGLPSSVKSVIVRQEGVGNAMRPYQSGDTVYAVGASGVPKAQTVKGLFVVGASSTPQQAGAVVTAAGPVGLQQGGIEVVGGGYGHAVGMSQWGAHGLALQGKTYAQILTHYFTGTRVEQR